MIEFENVTLSYNAYDALADVSFGLKENVIYGILGRNGAGKTSLFRLIAGYTRTSRGKVSVFGEEPYENPSVTSKVALVVSKNDQNNSFTVQEMMKLAADFRPNWDEGYAQRLLDMSEVNPGRRMLSLSRGKCAAVRAAIGLASRCEVTIYDEAYTGMDAGFRKIFMNEILDDFTQNPRTILFSTHYVDEMSKLFGEVLILDKGKVVFAGDSDELRQQRLESQSGTLQELFLELTGGIKGEAGPQDVH
jgi:ABC-2 type transport system ATP-binding protein